MRSPHSGQTPFCLENMESYNRIMSIPIVTSGMNIAENMYGRIKKTNNMLSWTLDQAEDTIKAVTHNPAIGLLETPLNTIDKVICKSLDIVESKIPSINLPPKMIYSNTKDYLSEVSTKIVKPVLKRADSVKQMGNTVLTSKYTEYAADKLDDALDVADAYIDKYFPDQEDSKLSKDIVSPTNNNRALHTMKHVDRVSKKLKRRLTKRTLEHAKLIKEQGTEAIHVLIYVAELIFTDPKLALQKAKELWAELSKNEPENQARPKNVEELFVLVVRESARCLVHLINYCSTEITRLPRLIVKTIEGTKSIAVRNTRALIQSLPLEEVDNLLADAMKFIRQEIKSFTYQVLEQARLPEPITPAQPVTIALAVPKIEIYSKAANSKANSNSSTQHRHRHHSDHHGHQGHAQHVQLLHDQHTASAQKKNGSHSSLHKRESSESKED
ncbi:lipid storage droplets surface-binding protein 1-like isoform X2 [Harmonia axyridis]|uniref:lipid storage droplets surface-binding protein 1-like isoform X1 n=1 Tax=Harmonia axyridis TaxID=115357 RepID=UPI001E277E80|nr:lipid storage droplets surface-binding protein 1-like isoform X1 [Harmonia axyridis]XP_045465444.1 lipid storage droplets surface-binding protein 1-like isoform X2 [Harmonia axyridis]